MPHNVRTGHFQTRCLHSLPQCLCQCQLHLVCHCFSPINVSLLSQQMDFHSKTDPRLCLALGRLTGIIQAGGPQQQRADLGATASMIQSQDFFWTVWGVCPDTTDGQQKVADGQLRDLRDQREVKERRKRSRPTQKTVRGASLAAVCFLLLILKSSVIRMRGREHVGWLRTAESMLGPGWWGNLTGH